MLQFVNLRNKQQNKTLFLIVIARCVGNELMFANSVFICGKQLETEAMHISIVAMFF